MTRAYVSRRNIVSLGVARSRVAASVSMEPVEVTVKRYTSGGLRGAGSTELVATFTGRINESEPNSRSGNVTSTDAYNISRTYTYLTALRGNDAVDGETGREVKVRRGDEVTIVTQDNITQKYTAGAVQEYRGHIEVELVAKA